MPPPARPDNGGNKPPPAKRIKPSDNTTNGNEAIVAEQHAGAGIIQRAWEHYRNFIDGDGGSGAPVEEGDEEVEDELCNGGGKNDNRHGNGGEVMPDRQAGEEAAGEGEEEQDEDGDGGGDVDELLELIEILSSTTDAVSPPLPLCNDPDDIASRQSLSDTNALLSILLSMSYLHLASHAISETMFDPDTANGQDEKEEEASSKEQQENKDISSSTPDNYFQQSLHYWPTNPAAHSLLANYHRMNSLSSTQYICEHYVKAAKYASCWRRIALDFLQSGTDEEEKDDDEEEELLDGVINAKEWVELLVLNGALDVDYIGGDEEEEEEEDDEDASNGGKDKKQPTMEESTEEYSCSQVEATASFMSAFLLSILSKHEEALPHLKKFQLSHRIHPNIWKEAQSSHGGNNGTCKSICAESKGERRQACDGKPHANNESATYPFFPPRLYHGSRATTNNGCGGVIPTPLYKRLCKLLAPNAQYWKESDYNHRGYYSYFIDLDAPATSDDSSSSNTKTVRECPTNIIEDVIVNHLLPLAEFTLQESTKSTSSSSPPRIVGAEWWAHTRPLGANLGHQIHFDTDESLLGREKKVTHPIISSVLYLTGCKRNGTDGTTPTDAAVAGSTIVFDQTPSSQEVAPQAWVSHPRDNSFMNFPGNLLHGVLPCAGGRGIADQNGNKDGNLSKDKEEEVNRLTFMVGFWTRNVAEGMGERDLYTPCGPLPPATSEHSWVIESQVGYSSNDAKEDKKEQTQQQQQQQNVFDMLPSVSPAWDKLDGKAIKSPITTSDGPALTIPKGLDHRFFVWNAPHCFSESLYDKEDCF